MRGGSEAPRRILILFPTRFEEQELARRDAYGTYDFILHGRGLFRGSLFAKALTFRILRFIDRTVRRFGGAKLDGVIGTSDYPGCLVAAAVARELGLTAPPVAAVLLAGHKYACRKVQQCLVPLATPAFDLLDPFDPALPPPSLPFPFFVKPVKGTLSMCAREVRDPGELAQALELTRLQGLLFRRLMRPFNQMLRAHTGIRTDACHFIAEELLRGEMVSVDGFVYRGAVRVMGVVDAVMYAGTRSFERFWYPSKLPCSIRKRMSDLASEVMRGIGYDNGMFNIEMMYDARRDSIHVVEINPRMSVQFSDLFEKVDGTSGYEVQLALASAKEPVFTNGRGRHAVAASFILRVFEDRLIRRIPRPSEVESLRVSSPDLRIRWFCREGRRLSRDPQDVESYRLGFVNLGAGDEGELSRRFDQARSTLRFVLASTG